MSDDDEPVLTVDEIEARIAKINAKGIGRVGAKDRGGKEKTSRKRIRLNVLKKTWRSDRYTFCCTTELKERIDAQAKSEGLSKAEWMEAAVLAKLEGKGGAS